MPENNETWIHGSDLLLKIGGKDTGFSTECQVKRSAETKNRATKNTSGGGQWDSPYVSKKKVTISTNGFVVREDGSTRTNYDALVAAWYAGEPVACIYHTRDSEASLIESGNFIITAMDDSAPVGDDATYSLTLESTGQVTYTPANAG